LPPPRDTETRDTETALTLEDRAAINEVIALHGHLTDEGELDRYEEVFAGDVVYDLEDFGGGALQGVAALRDAALALGAANPLGHHVTNVIAQLEPDGQVLARSKGIAVNADGSTGTVCYEDRLRRGEQGWRIVYRKVIARRAPLAGGRQSGA
jgi:hypothetical protein